MKLLRYCPPVFCNKIVIELVDGLVGMNVHSTEVSEFCIFRV